jgi:aspartyl aminopeptidase
MSDEQYINELSSFINNSVTPFHTVNTIREYLSANNYEELKADEPFKIETGRRYYINIYDSTLIAFNIGADIRNSKGKVNLRCSASHTDSPCFKVKPEYMIKEALGKDEGYVKLNTEVYGGPILNTWLDRPLSIAGKVVIKGKEWYDSETRFIDVKKPVLTIPNLAIHMNREVNKGVELNRQKDMMPVIGLFNENENYDDIVQKLIIEEIKKQGRDIAKEDISDYELFIYQTERGSTIGAYDEMYSSPRLDNLTSVFAQMRAIVNCDRQDGINLAIFYDNEEIGSATKQGAASQVIMLILEKIYVALGYDRDYMINDILSGMMVSIDVAHATHPNLPEKSDITNKVSLNGGIVIKESASQSYANDAQGISAVKSICEKFDCKYQIFVNRSDMPGGRTLGSISSTVLPMRTIDIGIPLLAMHSSRELMGKNDEKNLEKFLTGFYS